MKVLSIREPFATLVKDGVKVYETRSWKTNYRGELYIHACLSMSKSANSEGTKKYLKSEMNPGHILCKCKLVDCIPMTKEFIDYIYKETKEYEYGRYSEERFAWKLEVIKILDNPIESKGKLGIWNFEEGDN